MGDAASVPCCANQSEQTEIIDVESAFKSGRKWMPKSDPSQAVLNNADLITPRVNIREMLHLAIADLVRADGKATLTFDDCDSASVELVFTKAPLGIYYRSSAPLEITRLEEKGQGQMLGIKKGWKITHIQGYPITTVPFDEAVAILGSVTSALTSA